MKKEMLIKMREQLSQKVQEAFSKFMETATDEDVKKYSNLSEELNKVEEQIAALEAQEIKEGAKPKIVDEKPSKYSKEAREWAKKVTEAIAVGDTYTSLIPAEISTRIVEKLNDYGRIVNRVTRHNISGTYTFAVEGTEASVAYVAEAGSVTETTPALTPVTLSAYNLAALVKLSKEVVRDPAVDFIDWVITALGKGFAKKLDAEILAGTGSTYSHITGILTALAGESETPHIITDSTASGNFTWANLKKVLAKLGEYRNGGVLIMQQATADYIHEFKDNSQYIFDQNRPLESIWGMPVIICSQMQAMGTDGNYPVLAANLAYYHVGIRQDIESQILNETYAANRQVGIVSDMRVDGKPALLDAFVALKTDF